MIQINQNTQALIFDLDGTLANTMPAHYKACQLVCQGYGFEFPLQFFYDMAGVPTHQCFEVLIKQLGRKEDPIQLGDEKEHMFMKCIDEVTMIDPVASIIKEHPSLPRSIGSGGMRSSVIATLESISMLDQFEHIVSCDDVARHKPDPETFLKCAELMKVKPEHCEVFEDSDLGLEAARSAGMIGTDVRPFIADLNTHPSS